MAVCARVVEGPDGTQFLALDPTQTNLSTCAYVVDDGAGYGLRQLANLSIEDGNAIGLALFLVWTGAYCFRLLGKTINPYEESSSS